MRRTIVVAEVAVSLVLICGALLMFKSLLKLQRVDMTNAQAAYDYVLQVWV